MTRPPAGLHYGWIIAASGALVLFSPEQPALRTQKEPPFLPEALTCRLTT